MDYFIYSEDQINEKNQILNKLGKRFVAGTVIVNGTRQKFTQISKHNYITDKRRYTDAKVIASGDRNDFQYIMPSSETIVEG